ncbi:MAG: alpha/beta hydrolase [Chromatiales bacterium]|nr:alpha/beta hydrolase [Chromatiales bacterium]
MKWLRHLGLALAGIAGLGVAAFLGQAWRDRDIPAAELEARYASPASKFLNVDGVRIHYRDEGSGPVLVLIHANFSNLIGWDPWVDALKDSHRILRFDMTGHGLTGPDPSGDYSLERTVALTERFVDALGLERFSIGGTSLGGTVAIHYTAAHPDRVERLILLSPGALEGRAMNRAGQTVPAAANVLQWITPRALPAYMLRSRFGDPANVSDELIDQWHDMWRREGQRRAMLARLRSYSSVSIVTATAGVRVPTLILWGAANPQAPVEQAGELRAMLVNAPSVRVIIYPGVGHMAVEEAGSLIARDVRAFLDDPAPAVPPSALPASPPAAGPPPAADGPGAAPPVS